MEEHVAHSFIAMDVQDPVTSHPMVYDSRTFLDSIRTRISRLEAKAKASVALSVSALVTLKEDIGVIKRKRKGSIQPW